MLGCDDLAGGVIGAMNELGLGFEGDRLVELGVTRRELDRCWWLDQREWLAELSFFLSLSLSFTRDPEMI